MVKITSMAASATLLASTSAVAQVPSMGNAIGYAASGYIGTLALFVLGYFIGKWQFPDDPMWRLGVTIAVPLFLVGMGAMDWFTFGEWQGMPWENSNGSQGWRYQEGQGWSR